MLHKYVTEYFVDREELVLENGTNLLALSLDDVAAPHAYDFPGPEVAEKVFRADLAVEVAIVVPVLQ